MTDTSQQPAAKPFESLSKRELEILALLSEGLSDQEIAAKIIVAYSTVKWYNHHIYDKLGVASRREAVKRARLLGLVGTVKAEQQVLGKHNLPAQTTPFIGRKPESRDLAVLLDDPDIRLVTILAPGGMGKTRLALEVAARSVGHFADGVYFVPLASLSSFTDLIATIASSIGFSFYGMDNPKQQLLSYFRSQSLLLVLDNFEHLLDGTPLITEIIEAAPGIKVLVTSREKLCLSCETVYVLGGMSFPLRETADDVLAYDAVQLFVQNARRVLHSFTPKTDELALLTRITQLTQGMPLGIILAAAWIDALALPDVVNEINQGLELLQHDLRDVPERHHSIRAVFDPTWKRLTNEQQAVFMRLCVFRGGFTREAAQAVAHAGLFMLHTFIDKSLIQIDAAGRYTIHELLRQYGESHLVSSSGAGAIRDAHSAYHLDFLARCEADLKGHKQLITLREISADFENIRRAWFWAVEQRHDGAISLAVSGLEIFAGLSGSLQDVRDILQQTAIALAPNAGPPVPVWDQVVLRREKIHLSLTTNVDCGLIQNILERARARGDSQEITLCLSALADCALLHGDNTKAIALFEDSLVQRRALADEFSIADILVGTGNAHDLIGEHEQCMECLRESVSIRRRLGDRLGQVFPLILLGLTSVQASGDATSANRYLDEADAIRHEAGNMPALVYLFVARAMLAFWRGALDEAVRQAQAGLEYDQRRNWSGGRSCCLALMSLTLSARGEYAGAQKLCEEALSFEMQEFLTMWPYCGLALACSGLGDYARVGQCLLNVARAGIVGSLPDTLTCLPAAGFWLFHVGSPQRAVEVLGLAFSYPPHLNGWMHRWSRLTGFRAELEVELGADAYGEAWLRGSARDLKATWAEVVAEIEADNRRQRTS